MDAASVEFVEHFREEGRRPELCVTSAACRNALAFLKNACRMAKVGVVCKRRLSFLEPVVSRAQWFVHNPPATVYSDSTDPYHVQRPLAGGLRELKPSSCGK